MQFKNIFNKSAACACAGGSAFLAGHVGCIVTPLLLATIGVAGGWMPTAMVATGAVFSAAGLYGWYRLRGAFASASEKKLMVGGVAAGLALSLTLHFNAAHETANNAAAQEWIESLQPEQRVMFENAARGLDMSLEELAKTMCITPRPKFSSSSPQPL